MKLYNNLPCYELILNELDGVDSISLVEKPAIGINFMKFSENSKSFKFSVDEDKQILFGPAMIPDMYIFRNQPSEHYVMFSKQTIENIVNKFFKENKLHNISVEHEFGITSCTVVSSFLIDHEQGIVPVQYADLPDGTWIVGVHVDDNELWNKIKNAKINGFSIEGPFTYSELKNKNNNTFSMNKRLKSLFTAMLMKFGEVNTEHGVVYWNTEDDLKAGDEVFVKDEQDEYIAAPDGDYITMDKKTIVVVDGKVAEIKDPDAEVDSDPAPAEELIREQTMAEQPVEDPTVETDGDKETATDAIDAIHREINELFAKVDALTKDVETIKETLSAVQKMSAAKPAEEIIKDNPILSNSRLSSVENRAKQISNYLKK